MKSIFLLFLVSCCIFLNYRSIYAQPPNIFVELSSGASPNVDSAKSVFGLNQINVLISNTFSSTNCKIRIARSEFRINNSAWAQVPDFAVRTSHGDDWTPFMPNDSIQGPIDVLLYNLYFDENFQIQPFISGGMLEYRLVLSSSCNEIFTDTVFYSPVIHIWVPPATSQDIEALQYIIQQKSNCPELIYFFADFNDLTLRCLYVYEHLAAYFPNSVLGTISKYKIAAYKCLIHDQQLESVPEIKAEIMSVRDLLLVSEIPFIRAFVNKTPCMND